MIPFPPTRVPQVFKGIDTSTGDVVAIKQISLTNVSSDNLASVMGEIELLKTLHHKNIVKYIGSFKTRSHLYIILEFMENGGGRCRRRLAQSWGRHAGVCWGRGKAQAVAWHTRPDPSRGPVPCAAQVLCRR